MDNEFLDELMHLHGKDVWNLAYSITRKADLADDVTQDVFLKVYRKGDSFRREASIKTWLLKIARNTTYDYLKSSYLKKVTLLGALFENGAAPSAEREVMDQVGTDLALESRFKIAIEIPRSLGALWASPTVSRRDRGDVAAFHIRCEITVGKSQNKSSQNT